MCVCVCRHSYIISTYRTKRGPEQQHEERELQKHDWQQTSYRGARSIETCLRACETSAAQLVVFVARSHGLRHCALCALATAKRRQKFNWKANFNNHVVCDSALALLLLFLVVFVFSYSCCCCMCGALSIVPRALVLLFVAKRWRRSRLQAALSFHIHLCCFSCFSFGCTVVHCFCCCCCCWTECQQMMKNVPLERPHVLMYWHGQSMGGGEKGWRCRGQDSNSYRCVCECECGRERWVCVSTMTASRYEHAIHFHQTEFSLSIRSLRFFLVLVSSFALNSCNWHFAGSRSRFELVFLPPSPLLSHTHHLKWSITL